MPCNLYRRRHCLTAPRRRRATGSTRHQSIHVAGGRFFRRSDFRSLLGCGQRDDAILHFFSDWLAVWKRRRNANRHPEKIATPRSGCRVHHSSLFPPGSRSDGSDVTAQRVTRRTETRTHDGPDIQPPDTRPNAFARADTPIQSRPRLVPTARVRSPGRRISLFGGPRRRMSPRAAPDRKPDAGRVTWSYRGSKPGDTAVNAARFLNSNTLQDSQVRVHRPRRARRRASRVHSRFSS